MKNVLLAVSGLSPQVITETLYALFSTGRPVHEVQIITTRSGKEQLFKTLLSPRGPFDNFLRDYEIARDDLNFSADTTHVVCDDRGSQLDDIVDAEGNEALLKLCLERTFHLTGKPDQAVYFLIAGGRKTMAACLTAAAQFYGRPQDRIYHVLVTPEFESCRDFWYPPPQPEEVNVFTGSGLPCRMTTDLARIQLVDMPFVSLRDRLADDMLKKVQSPAELLAATIRDQKPDLTVNLAEGKLVYGEREVDVHPGYLALYGWFAERKKRCTRESSCRECRDCFVEISEVLQKNNEMAGIYDAIHGSRLATEMSDSGIVDLSNDNFQSYKSKLKKIINKGFGGAIAQQLVISSHGSRPETRYGILLEKKRIRMIW